MADLVDKTMEVSLALILVGLLLGNVALPIFFNVSTTGMTSSQALTWQAIPTLVLVGIIIAVIVYVKAQKKGR